MWRGAVTIVTVNLIKLWSVVTTDDPFGFEDCTTACDKVCAVQCKQKSRQSRDSQALPRRVRSKSESNLKCFQWFLLGQKWTCSRSNKQSPQKCRGICSIGTSSNGMRGRCLQILLFSKKEALFRLNEASSRRHLHGNMQITGKRERETRRDAADMTFWHFWELNHETKLGDRLHAILWSRLQLFSAKNMLVMNGLFEMQGLLEF